MKTKGCILTKSKKLMPLDLGFITRNYVMHLVFNGETTECGIKP